MPTLRSLQSGLRALFHRDRRNAEIAEELRSFFDASVQEKLRYGMSLPEAERAARAELGSAEMVRHKTWSAGWESVVESVWQDVRYAGRQILRSPGFSAVAIVSLALGIGANTAIFTLMNGLLLKRLPVHDPQQLVSFGDGNRDGTMEVSDPGPYDIFPYDFYRRLAHHQDQFEGVTAFASFPTMVSVRIGSGAAGPATQAITHLVSGTFFSVLGADPLLGRTFNASDTAVSGRSPIAVISHRYWQQAFAADPQIIGRTLTINGTAFTVVGVMPEAFYGVALDEWMPDMWLPITMQPQVTLQPSLIDPNGLFWIHVMARRKPGVPLGEAQSWVTAQLQQFLVDRAGGHVSGARRKQIAGCYIPLLSGESGISPLRSKLRSPLAVLMGIVGIVLLIACANLANLLLAKSASREHEFSTRLALGCNRARIVRQILTETLVLSLAGGIVGLAFAFLGTRALISFIAGAQGHTALSAVPDLRVLAFTGAVCLFTGLCFGIAPALRSARSSAAGTLNSRTANSAGRQGGRWLPRTLIVAQVALSLVLLAVAGLLLQSLHNLRTQDVGFNRTHVLLIRTNPKFAGYQPPQLNALYERILERVDALPGVRSATISGAPPMARGNWGSPIFIDGRPAAPDEDVSTLLNRIAPGYFETLGIPLLRGRTIGPEDTASSTKAVVVNQTLADRYFPRGDALGHTFRVADPAVIGTWQIVGIVRDAKYNSPAERPAPMAYLALEQLTGDDQYGYCLQVLSPGDPAKITGELRSALAQIDPNLPILETATLDEEVDQILDVPTLISRLSGFFSLLALALACIGLYGVMSYNVVRRTGEIGIRIALGAARPRVLWMILRESLFLLVLGVGLGLPASLAASRVIQAGLYGVSPSDPTTLALATLVIAGVILAAAWLPARRATRVDPVIALRYE